MFRELSLAGLIVTEEFKGDVEHVNSELKELLAVDVTWEFDGSLGDQLWFYGRRSDQGGHVRGMCVVDVADSSRLAGKCHCVAGIMQFAIVVR